MTQNNAMIKEKDFEYYTPQTDSVVYPEIWDGFNHVPFFPICTDCNNIINKYTHDVFWDNILCDSCENKKIYINVPYQKKDDAKQLGAKWDNVNKKWFIYNNNRKKEQIFSTFK